MVKRKKIGKGTITQLLLNQDQECAGCGCDLTETDYHVDYIKPLKKNGDIWISNLQILCIPCHREKTVKEGGSLGYMIERNVVDACPDCGKVIRGSTQKQVDFLILSHRFSKNCSGKEEARKRRSKIINQSMEVKKR